MFFIRKQIFYVKSLISRPCIYSGSDSEEEEEPVMKSKKSSKQKGTTSKAGPPKKDPVQYVSETGDAPSLSRSTFLLFQSLYMNVFLSADLNVIC